MVLHLISKIFSCSFAFAGTTKLDLMSLYVRHKKFNLGDQQIYLSRTISFLFLTLQYKNSHHIILSHTPHSTDVHFFSYVRHICLSQCFWKQVDRSKMWPTTVLFVHLIDSYESMTHTKKYHVVSPSGQTCTNRI